METATQAIKIALEIIFTYLLRNKILDLIARVLQAINTPLDFIVSRLEKTQSSLIRLNYRQRVLNLVLVSISFVMLFSEFGTLREILNATANAVPITIWRFNISVGTFASLAYLTIATILGFTSMEIIGVRELFQGVFFNDPPTVQADPRTTVFNKPTFRKLIALTLFLILIILAVFQGILGIQRFQLSSDEPTVSKLQNSYALPAFYFALGFLTPIIAGFALLSFDIFVALVAKFFISLILFTQKMVAVIYLAIDVVIQLISSPIEKILEFFGIYQQKNITEKNKDKVKPAIRTASLANNDAIYLQNKSLIYKTYMAFRRQGTTLMFLSDVYGVNFSVPSQDHRVSHDTTFQQIAEHLKGMYSAFDGKRITFKYINSEGVLRAIKSTDFVIDYLKITDTIIVDAYYDEQANPSPQTDQNPEQPESDNQKT